MKYRRAQGSIKNRQIRPEKKDQGKWEREGMEGGGGGKQIKKKQKKTNRKGKEPERNSSGGRNLRRPPEDRGRKRRRRTRIRTNCRSGPLAKKEPNHRPPNGRKKNPHTRPPKKGKKRQKKKKPDSLLGHGIGSAAQPRSRFNQSSTAFKRWSLTASSV